MADPYYTAPHQALLDAEGGVPDPSAEPDGQVLTTASGSGVWAAPSGGSGGGLVYVETTDAPGDLETNAVWFKQAAGVVSKVFTVADDAPGVVSELTFSGGSSTVYAGRYTAAGAQDLWDSGTWVEPVLFDTTVRSDNFGAIASGSRIPIPVDGWYQIQGTLGYSSTTGTRILFLYKNATYSAGAISTGTPLAREVLLTGQGTGGLSALVYLLSTDYVELVSSVTAEISSAVTADYSPSLALVKAA